MDGKGLVSRRVLIGAAGVAGGGLLLAGCSALERVGSEGNGPEHGEAEISPAEDLMREHGVLRRILLIYEESIRRIGAGQQVSRPLLGDAAAIVRAFVEQYHEKLEEDLLFPRFREAGELVGLTALLVEQHQTGRRLTDAVLQITGSSSLMDARARGGLAGVLGQFTRMYRPHAAREDTVLFPAIREIMPAEDLMDLGEEFEDKEHETFGERGFADAVDRVAAIEESLGIYDLTQFTPAV
jgi:hemerythrin-like domain-containing protein